MPSISSDHLLTINRFVFWVFALAFIGLVIPPCYIPYLEPCYIPFIDTCTQPVLLGVLMVTSVIMVILLVFHGEPANRPHS